MKISEYLVKGLSGLRGFEPSEVDSTLITDRQAITSFPYHRVEICTKTEPLRRVANRRLTKGPDDVLCHFIDEIYVRCTECGGQAPIDY